jgi:sugar lactone lactonase YvrE
MADEYRIACDIRCELGEGPLWSARDNAVYWVDILRERLYRYSPNDESVQSWSVPGKIGWVIERREKPGFIAGLQSGFHELTLDPFACRPIVDPEPGLPDNRMNDASAAISR